MGFNTRIIVNLCHGRRGDLDLKAKNQHGNPRQKLPVKSRPTTGMFLDALSLGVDISEYDRDPASRICERALSDPRKEFA